MAFFSANQNVTWTYVGTLDSAGKAIIAFPVGILAPPPGHGVPGDSGTLNSISCRVWLAGPVVLGAPYEDINDAIGGGNNGPGSIYVGIGAVSNVRTSTDGDTALETAAVINPMTHTDAAAKYANCWEASGARIYVSAVVNGTAAAGLQFLAEITADYGDQVCDSAYLSHFGPVPPVTVDTNLVAPSSLIAIPVTSSLRHLSWTNGPPTDIFNQPTSVAIERNINADVWTLIDAISLDTPHLADEAFQSQWDDTEFLIASLQYRVFAFNATARSAYSNIASLINITSVTPSSGPRGGGTPITITGTLFSGVPIVLIDGIPCLSVSLVNSTTITCISPASTAIVGAKTVSVTIGTTTDTSHTFTYLGGAIASAIVTPAVGSTLGGD